MVQGLPPNLLVARPHADPGHARATVINVLSSIGRVTADQGSSVAPTRTKGASTPMTCRSPGALAAGRTSRQLPVCPGGQSAHPLVQGGHGWTREQYKRDGKAGVAGVGWPLNGRQRPDDVAGLQPFAFMSDGPSRTR